MQYGKIISGRFISRPNRFIAYVETADGIQKVHVKNTGRCRELLLPGTKVYLEEGKTPKRKTLYDLIAVEKGSVLINMDAQVPNKVFAEWVTNGNFSQDLIAVYPEYRYGASRLDFCLETTHGLHFIEVKGVTLEEDGAARFPDAPTERGIKHIQELQKAVEAGHQATLCFILQFANAVSVSPNDVTHPAFGAALREAARCGVNVCAYDCHVTPESISVSKPVPVIL